MICLTNETMTIDKSQKFKSTVDLSAKFAHKRFLSINFNIFSSETTKHIVQIITTWSKCILPEVKCFTKAYMGKQNKIIMIV